MTYYIDGNKVTAASALKYLAAKALPKGYEACAYMTLWTAANRSEGCREIISELTDYRLEIVAA